MSLHLIDYEKNGRLFFQPDVARHIVRSLRKKTGEEMFATDGRGMVYKARIETLDEKIFQATILEETFIPLNWKASVACSLVKKDSRFEYFLEKATEIGVHRITPIRSERTLKPRLRLDRAQKIIEAAVQQSFNPYVPILDDVISLPQYLEKVIPENEEKYIATAIDRGALPLLEQQYSGINPVHILIGPEGDFTPSEVELAIQHQWVPVSLGSNRLRTDTAATMVVQMIKSCYHIKSRTTT